MQDIISLKWEVENVTFISDGAASPFKQCFLGAELMFFKECCEATIPWNFRAISHSKGVDGTGRSVEQAVQITCRAGQHAVSSAEAFASIAQERYHGIKIFKISVS